MASRTFQSGATRGNDTDKIDPEAALSPLVLTAYCEYIKKHRLQDSQEVRGDDNWQLGIPTTSYMKSLWRHLLEAWKAHRNYPSDSTIEDSLCAIIFNAQGMLHERLKMEHPPWAKPQHMYTEKEYGFSYFKGYKDGRASGKASATSSRKLPSRGELLMQRRQRTKPVSAPQPTIYPDDWPDGE